MPSKLSVRTWGTRFDSLPPSSPLASPNSSPTVAATEDNDQSPDFTDSPIVNRADKTPHDASVFVGSLPTNIDLKELGGLLSQHLAEFAQIKAVKVIHDSKGGVCAFVQCEDAESASKLIQTLQSSPPKPFFGRILRFEAARAYRSLLISYRTPTEKRTISTDDSISTETVELTLPSAMRYTKFRNSKSVAIHYDNEAIQMERHASSGGRLATPTHEVSLFNEPVLCDAASLEEICGFFGPLEHFQSYEATGNTGAINEDPSSFPAPHDAPRKPYMDQGCFEVKWAHRDDCMSALNTLRRIPHFTVTWAHAAPERKTFHLNGPHHPYPIYPQFRSESGPGYSPVYNSAAPRYNGSNQTGWKVGSRPATMRPRINSINQNGRDYKQELETDFPPLVHHKAHLQSDFDGIWVEDEPSAESEEKGERGFDVGSSPVFLERLSDVHPLKSNLTYRSVSISTSLPDSSQELELQLTPALARSPVTPKTPGSLFPPTPTSFHGEYPALFARSGKELSYRMDRPTGEQILDPTTLFVGGLEMRGAGAWDEEKVYHLFEKYDGLESVNVIRPNSGKAAFAFVKFGNADSPARAVAELHNHVIEGRPIRVQLRDCNPSRSPFRLTRGRGRYSYNSGHPFRQNIRSESKRDKSVDASESMLDIKSDVEVSSPSESPSAETAVEPLKPVEPEVAAVPERADTECSVQTEDPERYREWYEVGTQAPAPTATPPEGALGISYPLPAFYAPGSWMPPQAQYPVAFYPPAMYAVAPNSQPPPRYPGSSESDASGPVPSPLSMPPIPWTSLNYGYIPYQGVPIRPTDQSAPNQPPVTPTGFFRDEAGTLIPVYPPAIINQYMSNSPNQASPPAGVTVTVPATVPSPIPAPPMHGWVPSCPPTIGLGPNHLPPRAHPLPNPPPSWIDPAQLTNSGHHVPSLPAPLGLPMAGGPPFRGGAMGHPNGQKRSGRREQHHSKRYGGLRGRGSNMAVGNDTHMVGRQNIGDWTHWPETRHEVRTLSIS
ncbi:hypothetical protein C8R42DRAFT_56235 [Lentinula raphanica]|nr:hypothetical protein C8R42DRAFT_56235 [Lentinula raphanica]